MPSSHEVSASSSSFACSLIAGGIAGTTVDVSIYPVDTLKTRLQSSKGFAASGGFRGIYAGIGSAIVGSAPGAALFFVTYEKTKELLKRDRNTRHSLEDALAPHWREPVEHMLAASLGEVAACAVRVPTEVVKQRAQALQHPSSSSALREVLAKYTTGGVTAVWRELYRGWTITVFREIPFTMIQFPIWEALKEQRLKHTSRDTTSALESAAYGSISGGVAAAATTPLDVLKTRMMLAKDKVKLVDLVKTIFQQSGPGAFFGGIIPRVLWISAGGAIFLGSYQYASNTLASLL